MCISVMFVMDYICELASIGNALRYRFKPVARSGKGGVRKINKFGPKVGVCHQKGEGAGGGCAPSRASRGSF